MSDQADANDPIESLFENATPVKPESIGEELFDQAVHGSVAPGTIVRVNGELTEVTERREGDDGAAGFIVETVDGTEVPVEWHELTEEHVETGPCERMVRALA